MNTSTDHCLDEMNVRYESARRRALRPALREFVRNLPLGTSFSEFFTSLEGTPFQAGLRDLTISELLESLDSEQREAESSPVAQAPLRETRTRAGRAVFDTAMSDLLRDAKDALSEVELAELVGGSESQVQQSLRRLMDAGQALRVGDDSFPRYRWCGWPRRLLSPTSGSDTSTS